MTLKKRDLLILQQGILKVADLYGDNVRFSYAIAKNDKLIAGEVEAINKTIQPTAEFSEYEAKRVELVKTFAKKDGSGEAMISGNSYVFADKQAEEDCLKAVEEFKKPYQDLINKRKEQEEAYNALLDEATDVKLHMINENDLPRTITPAQLANIISIVE